MGSERRRDGLLELEVRLLEGSAEERRRSAGELMKMGAAGLDRLVSALRHGEAETRIAALRAMSATNRFGPDARRIVADLLRDECVRVRHAAAMSIAQCKLADGQMVGALTLALSDESSNVRYWACESLAILGSEARVARGALRENLGHRSALVRYGANLALNRMGELPDRQPEPGPESRMARVLGRWLGWLREKGDK